MSRREKEDPLLKAARRAERRAQQARQMNEAGSDEKKPGLAAMFSAAAGIWAVVQKYGGPVASFLGWTGGKLKDAFTWAAFERENGTFKLDGEGKHIFSKKRLGKVLVGTVAAVMAFNIAASAAYFYGTQFEELVYTTGKQEIETGELYQFTGCTSLPCSTAADNGKFYKIESSLLFPNLLYPEENVFANIPMQDAACFAKGYGFYFRALRPIYKKFEMYQHVYDVSCRPYTQAEKDAAIGNGNIQTTDMQRPVIEQQQAQPTTEIVAPAPG